MIMELFALKEPALQTFRKTQFLGDGTCNFGSSGIAVEVYLIHTVPIHMGPAQLQTMDGWKEE